MWYILDVDTGEVLATAKTRRERMQKALELDGDSHIIEWREE